MSSSYSTHKGNGSGSGNGSVAILIPCYNAATTLPALLQGVQSQTAPFSEVICYDDASTDETAHVAEAWGARVLRGERNRGVAYARNRLIEATSCDWIHFHDADDLIDPRFVEVMMQHAGNPRQVVLCSSVIRQADASTPPSVRAYDGINQTSDTIDYLLRQFVHISAGLFPTAALREVGGFCPYLRIAEDMDLLIRLAHSNVEFRAITDVLVTRVKSSESLTARAGKLCNRRYALLFLHRCFKHLPTRYHATLGEKAIHFAWQFYFRGLTTDARRAIWLANRCGVKTASHAPLWQQRFAARAGTEPLFWLLRQRARLNSSAKTHKDHSEIISQNTSETARA